MSNAIARVFVNDVDVGSLPANVYENVVAKVRRDRRHYVGQAINSIGVLFRYAAMVVRVSVAFWLLSIIALVLFSPDSTAFLISSWSKDTPAEIAQTLRVLVVATMGLSVFSLVIAPFFGFQYRYGYVNQFDLAINRHIRSLLEVPAEGDMRVEVVRGGDVHR